MTTTLETRSTRSSEPKPAPREAILTAAIRKAIADLSHLPEGSTGRLVREDLLRAVDESTTMTNPTYQDAGKTPVPYRVKYVDQDNRRSPKTDTYCCVCYKDIRDSAPGTPELGVHLVDGGPFALHTEDEGVYMLMPEEKRTGDLGYHRIGPDCAKKLGKDYVWVSR